MPTTVGYSLKFLYYLIIFFVVFCSEIKDITIYGNHNKIYVRRLSFTKFVDGFPLTVKFEQLLLFILQGHSWDSCLPPERKNIFSNH